MFYLHLLDGSRNHRGSIVAITETETAPVIEYNIGGSKLVDENGKPETFDIGWKLGPVPTKNNAKKLAYAIAREYNYDVMVDGQRIGLPYDTSKAAATLGSIKSTAKAEASRRNGAKGGRPKKEQP